MAETITFRPKPGVLNALDALDGNRSFHINAALTAYLGLNGEGEDTPPVVGAPARSGDESQASNSGSRPQPRRRARQAVPTPAGEEPPCPHPKDSRKRLPYGTQCTECGQMLR